MKSLWYNIYITYFDDFFFKRRQTKAAAQLKKQWRLNETKCLCMRIFVCWKTTNKQKSQIQIQIQKRWFSFFPHIFIFLIKPVKNERMKEWSTLCGTRITMLQWVCTTANGWTRDRRGCPFRMSKIVHLIRFKWIVANSGFGVFISFYFRRLHTWSILNIKFFVSPENGTISLDRRPHSNRNIKSKSADIVHFFYVCLYSAFHGSLIQMRAHIIFGLSCHFELSAICYSIHLDLVVFLWVHYL